MISPQATTDALHAKYRDSLSTKLAELAGAWERWLAAPADAEAKTRFQFLAHKLAGSAPLYGFVELGEHARDTDQMLAHWEAETPTLRLPLEQLLQRTATSAEALLRVLGRESRAAGSDFAPRAHEFPNEPARVLDVLLVEDDDDQAEIWRESLAQHAMNVRHVSTREALEAEVALKAPDVMVFDYWLEPYTGPQLVCMLRDLPEIAQIPKLCLTGDTGPVPRQAAMDAGFSAVVRKTVDPPDLADVLRQLVNGARRPPQKA